MMTHDEVIHAITRGGFNAEQLMMINDALKHAYKVDRMQRLTDAQHSLHTGQTVRLKGIRPKRLNGIVGKIQNWSPHATRADLLVTDANWGTRYNVGDMIRGIPLVCFEPAPVQMTPKVRKVVRLARR